MKPKDVATEIHSAIVRSMLWCEHCGAQAQECAHILSRRYSNTRTDLRNGVALCSKCHRDFTIDPQRWEYWCSEVLSIDIGALRDRAYAVDRKIEWSAEVKRLLVIAVRLDVVTEKRALRWGVLPQWRELRKGEMYGTEAADLFAAIRSTLGRIPKEAGQGEGPREGASPHQGWLDMGGIDSGF